MPRRIKSVSAMKIILILFAVLLSGCEKREPDEPQRLAYSWPIGGDIRGQK